MTQEATPVPGGNGRPQDGNAFGPRTRRRFVRRLAITAAACVFFLCLFPAAMVYVDSSFKGETPFYDGPERELIPFAEQSPRVGELAPDFVLRDVDGKPYRLHDRAGRAPVVIEFGSFT